VLSTYAEVPDLRWAVIVEQPAAEALADLEQLHRYSILLIGIGLLVGFGNHRLAESKDQSTDSRTPSGRQNHPRWQS
jgi:hypothetical protein